MTTMLTTAQRLERVKTAGMILGGCRAEDGKLVEISGWIARAADVIDIDPGNFSNILAGRRTLTTALEDKVAAAIRRWRDEQVQLVKTALTIAGQIDAERQAEHEAARQAELLAAQLSDGAIEDDALSVSPRDARALQRAQDMGIVDGRAVYSLDDAPDYDDDGPAPGFGG